MASYNKVILLGNLTREPELRVTPKGTAICQFGLAVNRKYKDGTGALKEEVTFVDVEAWDKAAENIAKYVGKGDPLLIEGRLKLDTWDDKTTGQKRSKLKVVADTFQLLGSKRDGGGGGGSEVEGRRSESQRSGAAPAARPPATPPPQDNIDEDVPF